MMMVSSMIMMIMLTIVTIFKCVTMCPVEMSMVVADGSSCLKSKCSSTVMTILAILAFMTILAIFLSMFSFNSIARYFDSELQGDTREMELYFFAGDARELELYGDTREGVGFRNHQI